MNRKRMLELLRVCVSIPKSKFNMKTFCYHSCQTTYCLAGWATLDDWHQKNTEILQVFEISDLYIVKPRTVDTFFDLGVMYGLNDKDCSNLFGGQLNDSDVFTVPKRHVIRNIMNILNYKPTKSYKEMYQDDLSKVRKPASS